MTTLAQPQPVATVLRDAIQDAGLTITAAAAAAGVSRPQLQEYLSGRREPSYAMVQRILAALPRRQRRPSEALEAHRDELVQLLHAAGVTGAVLFGSTARGEDTELSDLDVLLQFPDGSYPDLERLQERASKLLGVRVELLDVDWASPELAHRAVASGRPL